MALCRTLLLAAVATVASAAPIRRHLFSRGSTTVAQGRGVMVYHLNHTTGNCGDTNMTSNFMTTDDRQREYVVKALQYMDRTNINLEEGTCASVGYHRKAGTTRMHVYGHSYTITVWGKGGGAPAKPKSNTIVDVAVAAKLTTLVTAVKAAGLVAFLSSKGPFTVFAPTNFAFTELPKGLLAKLLEPRNKASLVKLLEYHVVKGAVLSTQLHDAMKVPTLDGGKKLEISVDPGLVAVNDAVVSKANVKCSNGVVHVISKVLIPPGFAVPAH